MSGRGERFRRGERYTIPHRMPDSVPLSLLRAGVISDIRHAEDGVPLICGEWVTDAGIHYLDSILDDPEYEHFNTPQDFYRKSWREGLTSTQPESKVEDMASIRSTKSKAAELRAEADRLAAERELVLARIAEAEAAASKFNEPGPNSKVLIEATFPGSYAQRTAGEKTTYEYLAMRIDNPRSTGDNWYVTGQKGKTNWAAILRLVENAREVEIFDLDFER